MTSSLRVVFAGTPAFGIPCLEALLSSHHELIALYTQPDRPAGRGKTLQCSQVKTWGLAHQIPIYQPETFKLPDTYDTLLALAPDIMVVIAYGLLLPKRILAIPRLGCINVHASLLPRWRGASPIQHAILSQDTTTGITIMQMDAGMDTGDSLKTVTCAISPTDTTTSLQTRLSLLAPEPLLDTMDELANGRTKATPQCATSATYAPKINKQDARIDWHCSASVIDCLIRAYDPWPIAFSQINEHVFRVHKATVVTETSSKPPGTILAMSAAGMLVNTAEQALLIKTIQYPGGKPISIADVLNAKRTDLDVGMVLQ